MRDVLLLATAIIAVAQIGAAAVKVHVDVDKAFDLRKVRTWSWGEPKGHVMVARTPTDDPDAIQKLAEPVVMDAVLKEMPGRGLTQSTDNPNVTLKYYLLLTVGSSAQTMGQFLPAVSQWAMPPFLASTQSLQFDPAGLARARSERRRRDRLERHRRIGDQAWSHPGTACRAHPRSDSRHPAALSENKLERRANPSWQSSPPPSAVRSSKV